MKNEEKKKQPQSEIDKAWQELWELAQNQIIWDDCKIDHDGFISEGKKIFELQFKKKYFGGKA